MKKYINYLGVLIIMILCGCSTKTELAENYNCFTREELAFDSCTDNPYFTFVYPIDNEKVYIYEYSSMLNNGEVFFTDEVTYKYNLNNDERTELIMPPRDQRKSIRVINDGEWVMWNNQEMNVLSSDGVIINSADLSVIPFANPKAPTIIMDYADYYDGSYWYIVGIDEDGGSSIYILDSQLHGLLSKSANNKWKCVVVQGEYCFFDSGSESLMKYDRSNNELVEVGMEFPGNEDEYSCAAFVTGDSVYDYYFYFVDIPDNQAIEDCLYGVKNGKRYAIFNMKDMGLEDFVVQSMISDENGGFWCLGFYKSSVQDIILYHFKPSDNAQDYSMGDIKEKS